MKPFGAIVALAICGIALQGCVAAAIPLAAAGMVGKTRVDAAKRAHEAEQDAEAALPNSEPAPIVTVGSVPDLPPAKAHDANTRPPAAEDAHPYVRFAEYALEQKAARDAGQVVRSAVLVKDVSLTSPQTIGCEDKPMAVIIDVDRAPGSVDVDHVRPGLAALLDGLRVAQIRIAWAGEGNATALEEALKASNADIEPYIGAEDMFLGTSANGLRKQEQRWALGRDYCVIAIAGDRRSDFDELYDYLRNPDYAIGLERFVNRGWFEAPSPLAMHVEGGQ